MRREKVTRGNLISNTIKKSLSMEREEEEKKLSENIPKQSFPCIVQKRC